MNYQKIDQLYSKNLKVDYIDYRFFLKDKPSVQCTPSKFIPFARQGAANRAPMKLLKQYNNQLYNKQSKNDTLKSQNTFNNSINNSNVNNENKNPNKTFHSHRILNYQNDLDKKQPLQQKNLLKNSNLMNLSDFKFSSTSFMTSPYKPTTMSSNNPKKIPETPMTSAMEMYTWLHTKHQNLSAYDQLNILPDIIEKVQILIEKVVISERNQEKDQKQTTPQLSNHEKKTKETRKNLILTLYKKLVIEISKETQLDVELTSNQMMHTCLLLLAIETVYFILNVTKIQFYNLVQIIQVSYFDLWMYMDFYLKFDINIPMQLKTHILGLEQKIISYYVWKQENQTLYQFIAQYMQGKKIDAQKLQGTQEQTFERFFRRVLHQCAYTIWQITENINLNEKIQEGIWTTIKYIMSNETELMMNRHLEQIILCTVYSICKVLGNTIKFQEIISHFEDLCSQSELQMDLNSLIYNIQIDNQLKGDIIFYYNQVYIKQMKAFIINLQKKMQILSTQKPQTPGNFKNIAMSVNYQNSKNPVIHQSVLQSPLKMIIPQSLQQANRKSQQGKNILQPHMTPQTQMLFAYNESPLLKMNNSQFLNNQKKMTFKSKKMINFDEVQNQNQGQQKPRVIENYHEETQDFINRKFQKNKQNYEQQGSQRVGFQGMLKYFPQTPNENNKIFNPNNQNNVNNNNNYNNNNHMVIVDQQENTQQNGQLPQQQMQNLINSNNSNNQYQPKVFSKINFDSFKK